MKARARAESVGRATSHPWRGEELDCLVKGEVERFCAYLRAEKRSGETVKQYGKVLQWFLEWFRKNPKDLTEDDLQRWKGFLSVEKGYRENTMSKMIAAVNQYTERIMKRPDLKMRPPRRVIRTKIPLTEDEISRILEEARKPRQGRNGFPNNADASLRDHAAICLMYYGGLRASEVVNLRISDLDLDKKRIRVHEGKGMDHSMVNVHDVAVESLKAYLERGRPRPSKPEYADHLILSIRGHPLRRDRLWAQTKRIAFWAGIEKNVHPHIFRHSMVTHMAENGASVISIQAQSRHKSLDMVQRYAHPSEKSIRDAYDSSFAKKTPSEKTEQPPALEDAQKRKETPARSSREDDSLKERLLELYLDGKISDDKLGRLEKLFASMDGPRNNAPQYEGYA